MGVYSIDNLNTYSTATIDFDAVGESALEPNMAGAYAIVAESERNYNAIMQAIGIHELAVLESTGAEVIYEAADIKGFFKKIKDFFLSILAKIAELVKKFFRMIDQHAKNDSDFVKKYRAQLINVKSLRDFECEGYNFTHVDNWSASTCNTAMTDVIKSKISTIATFDGLKGDLPSTVAGIDDTKQAALKLIIEKTEDTEEVQDNMRKAALDASSAIDASEFAEEIFKYFHDGDTVKASIKTPGTTDLLREISSTENVKKAAKTAYISVEKTIKEEIKNLDRLESSTMKLVPGKAEDADPERKISKYNSDLASAIMRTSSITKTKLNMINQVYGGLLTAIKDRNSQARSIVIKMINYKPKNEGFDHYTEGTSFLDAVVLK